MLFKQIHPLTQTILSEVNCIYQHPYHYTYVLHKTDGFLHLYDVATMDVVGRTKVLVLDQMKLFAFALDFNIIYGLRESRFLCFQLTSSQWLTHQPIETSHEPRPYQDSYYLSFHPKKQILICVTSTNFFFINPNIGSTFKMAPQLKYQDQPIFPQKVAEISPHMWIVGYKNYIYFMKFSQSYESYDIYGRLITGNLVKLSTQHHPKREFVYVINDQGQVLLIRVNQEERKLQLCYKFYHEKYTPMYLTLLRLGINTSTTDKLRDRMYINIYCEEKQPEKIVEEKPQIYMVDEKVEAQEEQISPLKQYSLLIITTETQYPADFAELQERQEKQFSLNIENQVFVIREMPEVKVSPWTNILTENCIMFLNTKNEISCINFCSISEMNLKADQWICMGYKFEMLQKNKLYEEIQSQFEDSSQKEEKSLTKQFLDDWSQSNMPKNIILNRAFNRMRSVDI